MVLPDTISGKWKSGAVVPRGNMVEGVSAIGLGVRFSFIVDPPSFPDQGGNEELGTPLLFRLFYSTNALIRLAMYPLSRNERTKSRNSTRSD